MNDLINIIDVPLKDANDDKLNTRKYVEGLAEYLSKSSMPTTVAIQGQWGSGKTSFMNQLRSILCEEKIYGNNNNPLYYGVWINMWEYSIMQTPEQTLIGVIKGMINECSKIIENQHPCSSVTSELKEKTFSFLKKTATILATSAIKVGANTLCGNGEEIASAFQDVIGDNLKETRPKDFRDAFEKAVKECIESQNSRRGFMFFIDDLDRINPENAVQILELLKNMFEVDNCIFVLAIDYDVVVKGLKSKFGNNTGDDDRAFRSFFDKIIQMPFSMPIGAYDTTAFLKDSLNSIGYLSISKLEKEITLKQENGDVKQTVLDVVDEMTRLSTGTIPRSIKRLLNTLSLIKIISNIRKDENEEEMDEYDHLMNYGLVCLQIAYPDIYDRITQDPYYLDWNESTARQFRLKPLPKDKLELLDKIEEFDEPWEQVVYQICQTSNYLMSSALNISKLLNIIRSLYDVEKFGAKINKMLGMTSVTSVTQSDNLKLQKSGATNQTEQKRFDYWVNFQKFAFKDSGNEEFVKNFKERKPSVDQWMDFSIGFRSCHITISQIIKRDELDVELYINDGKTMFPKLLEHRAEIEEKSGLVFDWRELPERKASRIIIVKENVGLDDPKKWNEQFGWLMNVMLSMKKAFTEILKNIE